MEPLKKCRSVIRSMFTRSANNLQSLLDASTTNLYEIEAAWESMQQKDFDLKNMDKQILDLLLTADSSEDVLTAEFMSCEEYSSRFVKLKVTCTHLLKPNVGSETGRRSFDSQGSHYKLKLPKMELREFSGDARDWLPFWSRFKKIHDDHDLAPEDKLQFLLQAMTPGSRARELVESYPPVRQNYEKAVESLKSRFGRDDVLVEVYVRELLKIVLNTTMSAGAKMVLSTLYDKVETQLRSLETLGVTTDKCAAMLYPLVESCLPEELLRAWHRSFDFSSHQQDGMKSRLEGLMKFVRSEVENEEKISLAAEGFGLGSSESRSKKNHATIPEANIPNATGLMAQMISKCVFCDGSHGNDECFKARDLSLDEKRKILSEKRACFRCLKIGHQSRKCRVKLRCVICEGQHALLLCPELPTNKRVNEESEKVKDNVSGRVNNVLTNHTNTHVFLQTLRVVIRSEFGTREVRAVIDSGSQRSYVLKSMAEELHYPVKRREKIVHALFGGLNTTEQEHMCYDIQVLSKEGQYCCTFEAIDQPLICQDVAPVFYGSWMSELQNLHIKITDSKDAGPIELLIGADVAGKLLTGRRHVLKCGLVAIETLLGWTLMGKIPIDLPRSDTTTTVLSLFVKDMSVEQLWQLDVLGIADPIEKQSKKELELAATELFEKTVTQDEDGRYEVSMPWLDCHPMLPTNLSIAKRRLESVLKKLENDGRKEQYGQIFKEWEREGIIEETTGISENVHYLPHRPVYKEESLTTKIRPVFDASAKEKGRPSLNQCLEKGPNMIELIPAILLRFRMLKIGVVSDIAKAFLQIGLHHRDRDFLRFLWRNEQGEDIVYRHKRVVFGVSCSPYLLGATIDHHLKKCLVSCKETEYSQDTIKKLRQSFYVDNCVTSVSNEEQLFQFIRESSQIMDKGKFDLRGWEFTSDNYVNKNTPVLGLMWNREMDTLSVKFTRQENIMYENVTKRLILSIAQQVFDPIGFICPVALLPKILLQRMWETKLSWDSEVDTDTREQFLNWAEDLPILSNIKVSRWLGVKEDNQKLSLHVFSDASQQAYAAVIFLRIESDEKILVELLQAKARIAPLKKLSIPRLELLAATIAARLYETIRRNFERDIETYFWSDSSTVLSWIRRTDEWATFVWNRIQEIRQLTPIEAWRHVPGNLNPADLPSRGCSAKYLLDSKWWEGPKWLYGPAEKWPEENLMNEDEVEEEIAKERKKKLVTVMVNNETNSWYSRFFSRYSKIVRMISWIRRFVHNCSHPNAKKQGELTAEELQEGEKALILIIQKESFIDENDKRLSSLNAFKAEDGVIRLRTSISRREDTEVFRYPFILPAHHPVVRRLIFEEHVKSCHIGLQGLMSILREKYWVLGGRRAIRYVTSRCVSCKRHNAKRLEIDPPPLSIDRVKDAATFEVTGIDLAGPLFLRGKKSTKAWICLFTCAIYRAVHLDFVTSLSTSSFMAALRRFIARRGRPKIIYTDNGTNFVGTENHFCQLDWPTKMQFSSAQRIKWRFNPPSAPWWGGWWERLIGMVKQLLRRVLGRACLNGEELYTLLCDCEAVINARPLTYVSNEPNELVSLTPAMFMRELIETGVPDCDLVDAASLTRRFVYLQRLRDDLRSRFRVEYLGQLKQVSGHKKSRQVAIGDVVLIGNDLTKRINWPLGRVIELCPGRDGKVRLVRLKTSNGNLLRPIQRIYPLECSEDWAASAANQFKDVAVCEEKHPTTDLSDVPESSEVRTRVTRRGRPINVPKRYLD